MKTTTTFLLTLFMAYISANAQDVLILKSGEELNAKVLEVGTQEIKYKKFENLDGPFYSISKDKLFMIKYQNGTKEIYSNTSDNESQSVLKALPVQQQKPIQYNTNSQRKLHRGKVLTGVGTAFTTVGTALLISGRIVFKNSIYYSNRTYYYDYIAETNGIIMMSVGAVAFSAGLPMMITGLVKMGSAKKEIRMSKNSAASMMISPSIVPANYTKSGTAPGLYFGLTF